MNGLQPHECTKCGSGDLVPPKINGSGRLVQRRICRSCFKPVRRAQDLWSKYRIREDDYDRMVEQQGDCCAVCGGSDKGRRDVGYWSVDHDHETGQVRGLLCRACNVNLHVVENQEFMEKAIAYLRDHGSQWASLNAALTAEGAIHNGKQQ